MFQKRMNSSGIASYKRDKEHGFKEVNLSIPNYLYLVGMLSRFVGML